MGGIGAVGDLRHRLGGYRDHAPPPELAAVAEGVWVYRTPADAAAPANHRVLPDPAVSVAFWCRRERDGRLTEGRLVLIGAKTRPHLAAFEPGCEIAAVRLKVEWTEPLLGLVPAEHHDAEHDLSQVLPPLARPLLDALAETRDAGQALAVLTGALAGPPRNLATLGLAGVARALELVRATKGRMPVERVADHVDVSLRQLRRNVRRAGVSLKTYARTTRFLRAMTAADRSAAPAWARIAAESGYCDQSHLVRECRALAGMAPGDVHRERRAEGQAP
jgi:AraC-like DNA-binding protein